jgi:hypothetical protein
MTKPTLEFIEWVLIAKAENPTEAIMLKMLLNRTGIPYHAKNEFLHQLYGFAGTALSGPVEFMVPAHLKEMAEESIHTIFELESQLPPFCPACDCPTQRGRLDCPGCGLVLA